MLMDTYILTRDVNDRPHSSKTYLSGNGLVKQLLYASNNAENPNFVDVILANFSCSYKCQYNNAETSSSVLFTTLKATLPFIIV